MRPDLMCPTGDQPDEHQLAERAAGQHRDPRHHLRCAALRPVGKLHSVRASVLQGIHAVNPVRHTARNCQGKIALLQIPRPKGLRQVLKARHRLPAENETARIPVKPVDRRRRHRPQILPADRSTRKKPAGKKIRQCRFRAGCRLNQHTGRFIENQHVAVLVNGRRLLPSTGKSGAVCPGGGSRSGFAFRARCAETRQRFLRQKQLQPVSGHKKLAAGRFPAVQKNALLPQHLVQKAAPGIPHIFPEKFIEALSRFGLPDDKLAHIRAKPPARCGGSYLRGRIPSMLLRA